MYRLKIVRFWLFYAASWLICPTAILAECYGNYLPMLAGSITPMLRAGERFAATGEATDVQLTLSLCENAEEVQHRATVTPIQLLGPAYKREIEVGPAGGSIPRQADSCIRPYFFRGFFHAAGGAEDDYIAFTLIEDTCLGRYSIDGSARRNNGVLVLEPIETYLSLGPSQSAEMRWRGVTNVERTPALPPAFGCDHSRSRQPLSEAYDPRNRLAATPQSALKHLLIATELNYEYFDYYRNRVGGAFGRALSMMNNVSALLEATGPTRMRLIVTYQRGWSVPADPYTYDYIGPHLLEQVFHESIGAMSDVSFHITHLFWGRSTSGFGAFAGVAGANACSSYRGTSISHGIIPFETGIPLVAHELTHGIGDPDHDGEYEPFLMNPFIQAFQYRHRYSQRSANAVGSFRADQCLQPLGAPIFIAQPKNVVVPVAPALSPVEFSAEAVSPFGLSASLSYQWFEGDNAIPGATSPTLSVPVTSIFQHGRVFWAKVTNVYGDATSRLAKLSVLGGPPVLLNEPIDAYTTSGSTVSFRVLAYSPGFAVQYKWFKKRINPPRTRNPVYADPIRDAQGNFVTTPELTIRAGVGNNGLTVFCEVTNQFGTVRSREARLSVFVPPTVPAAPEMIHQPENAQALVGRNTYFIAEVRGEALSYQWYRNGVPMPGEIWPVIHYGPVSGSDDGALFSLMAWNDGGRVTSREAKLTVLSQLRSVRNSSVRKARAKRKVQKKRKGKRRVLSPRR